MTALADKQVVPPARLKADFPIPVAADVVIYPGARCAIVGGYLQPADESAGLKNFCTATNKSTVDNTGGAAGDVACQVEFDDVKTLMFCRNDTVSPITATDIGESAYIVDDSGVVSADGTGRSRLGTPWIIVGANDGLGQRAGVYVEADGPVNATLLATLAATAPSMQAVNATLAGGSVTISTGITVAANSEVMPLLIGALTGTTNFGSLGELKASRVNGAPGVGAVVIQAYGNDGALDVDAAGAIRVVIMTPQS